MDLADLLLLLVFVLFPLLQQLLGRRKSPTLPPEVETDEDDAMDAPWRLPDAPPAERPLELPQTTARTAGGDAPAREESADLQILRTRVPQTESEVERVSTQVVSMEPLFVNRPVSAERRVTPLSGPARVTARRYTEPRAAVGLHSRDEVRRALLLGEILGPPKSMD